MLKGLHRITDLWCTLLTLIMVRDSGGTLCVLLLRLRFPSLRLRAPERLDFHLFPVSSLSKGLLLQCHLVILSPLYLNAIVTYGFLDFLDGAG